MALYVTSSNPSGRSVLASSPTAVGGNQQKHIVNLILDDLPTYTGWTRPNTTKVCSYHIVSTSSRSSSSSSIVSQQQHKLNEPWSVTIQCHGGTGIACDTDSPQFYMRAYGPSVTTGQLMWNDATHYEFTFVPRDAGIYTVELVLTFFNVPKWDLFPLDNVYDPGFEGYLVPGFPLQIKVVQQQEDEQSGATTLEAQGTSSCGQSNVLYSYYPYKQLDVNHMPA